MKSFVLYLVPVETSAARELFKLAKDAVSVASAVRWQHRVLAIVTIY